MKKVLVWRNAFVGLLAVLLTFAVYQHFWAKRISAQSTTSTRILIPLYVGAASVSSDTVNLLVENTSMDPYGTTPSGSSNATCEADFYSGGTHYGPYELDSNIPGQVSVWNNSAISTASLGAVTSPGQMSYLFLTCNFPYAHAQVQILNSSGGVGTIIPGYVIPPNRSFATGPEQLLQ
ncbi:MAG: hypothetical protein ABSA85_06985 [Terracidiphilus sp.]|jgi:hypothetical protein